MVIQYLMIIAKENEMNYDVRVADDRRVRRSEVLIGKLFFWAECGESWNEVFWTLILCGTSWRWSNELNLNQIDSLMSSELDHLSTSIFKNSTFPIHPQTSATSSPNLIKLTLSTSNSIKKTSVVLQFAFDFIVNRRRILSKRWLKAWFGTWGSFFQTVFNLFLKYLNQKAKAKMMIN